MKKIKLFAVLAILLVVIMSCQTATFSGLQMTKDMDSFVVVKDFETTVTVWEFLGSPGGANLFNVSADAMDEPVFQAVQNEIQKLGGDAAVDITLVQEATLVDMIIGGVTGSILAPCKVHITGTVVKFAD